MKNVICLLLFCLSLTHLNGQGWERLYPINQHEILTIADLIPTPDGGFLLNSSVQYNPPPFDSVEVINYFHRISADGTLLWKKTHEEVFGATVLAMWPAESNHLLFVTFQNDTVRLMKTDASLEPVWSQVLDGAGGFTSYKVRVRTAAGGYVVAFQENGQQGLPVQIVKTDLNGALIWANDYTFTTSYSYQDFATDKQGNLYLFGVGGSPYWEVVSKVSPAGVQAFVQPIPGVGFAFSPVLLNDNLLAFLDFQNHLQFIDSTAQLVQTLNAPSASYRIAATPQQDLIVAKSAAISEMRKIQTDSTVIWSHTYNNLNAFYDKAPFALWSLPDGGAVALFMPGSGIRPLYVVRTDANGLVYTNQLHGNIFADADNDCNNTSGVDFPAPAVTIVAQKGDQYYYATTDTLGNYEMSLDTGTYLIRLLPPGGAWEMCSDSLVVTLGAYDTLAWSTGINSTLDCPWPGVDLSALFLRRCFNSTYQVAYGNSSEVAADSAVVTLTLDPFLTLETASLPFTSEGDNVYKFPIGDLAPLQTGAFQVTVKVDCSAELGQTHCSSAEINISNPCPTTGIEAPLLKVTATCEGDSVAFNIQNIGAAPMTEVAELVIIEELIVMRQEQFQLPVQEHYLVKCPANGKTSRIYAGQAPGEPPFFATTTAIEGCNGPLEPGVWNMFPEIIARQDIDNDCQQNIGAFDPNDKQAVPTGYDTEHYIAPGVGLDYKIRFQNTGTDTAFNVVIRDTLSSWLEGSSVRPGAASHPYTWQLMGPGVLQFKFDNIRLPDSTTNLAESQGFISFHIEQKPEVPLQTLIENRAAIFFDFNEPVLTNTTFHQVGEELVSVAIWEPQYGNALVKAAPNPFSSETRLEVTGLVGQGEFRLQIFDIQGNMVQEMTRENGSFQVKKGYLGAGIYLFSVQQNGRLLGKGKLVVQ